MGEYSKLETLISFEVDPKLRRDLSKHFSPITTATRFDVTKEQIPPRNTAVPQSVDTPINMITRSQSVHNPLTQKQIVPFKIKEEKVEQFDTL
jgi:hypothetical protein